MDKNMLTCQNKLQFGVRCIYWGSVLILTVSYLGSESLLGVWMEK